jgi:hypothetical protein
MNSEPAERGRYAVYDDGSGGLVIARAAPLCETCTACGCGEQADPITVPAMLVALAKNAAAGGKMPGLGAIRKAVMSRAGNGSGGDTERG